MSIIGSAPWLLAKPASPSQWDDEFEASGLDPKWTRVTGGPHSTTQDVYPLDAHLSGNTTHNESIGRHRPGWFMRQPRSGYGTGGYSATSEGLFQDMSALPTNCFIWLRGTRNDRLANNMDGDGEIFMTMFQLSNPINAVYCAMDSFSSGTNGNGTLFARTTAAAPTFTNIGQINHYFRKSNPCEFIGIQKRGNVWDGWCATYTGNWVWLGSFTHAVTLDSIVISFNNAQVLTPGNMLGGIDFFRVTPGTQLP